MKINNRCKNYAHIAYEFEIDAELEDYMYPSDFWSEECYQERSDAAYKP